MSGEAVPGRAAPSGPPPNDAYTVRRLAANTYDWLAPKLSSPERKALDRIMALMDEGMALRAAPSGEPSAAMDGKAAPNPYHGVGNLRGGRETHANIRPPSDRQPTRPPFTDAEIDAVLPLVFRGLTYRVGPGQSFDSAALAERRKAFRAALGALGATPAEPGARPPTFDGPDVGIEAVARGLDALADEDIHGGATYETCRAGARFLRAQAECIAAWHRWEKSAARSPSPPHALVEKWAALATSGDGRHPEAAETLSRCASELKGALAARSPAPAGDGPTCGKCKQRVEGDGYCPDCHIWTEGYGPAGDAALERWVETGIYEPTPDAPREDALRDDEGDPTTAEAGEWVVDCVRDGEFTVSNGLRTYRTEYLGNAERLASWLRQAALRGAVSRLRGLTRGQHEP
jgi:hypothetical protein